mmetsp:Transcript_3965/g.4358  ORF Transcript_3965/g.4358 Transcript_3965/m.4358 type:complete len:200 (-) Transcript_3965:2096-2695(-)
MTMKPLTFGPFCRITPQVMPPFQPKGVHLLLRITPLIHHQDLVHGGQLPLRPSSQKTCPPHNDLLPVHLPLIQLTMFHFNQEAALAVVHHLFSQVIANPSFNKHPRVKHNSSRVNHALGFTHQTQLPIHLPPSICIPIAMNPFLPLPLLHHLIILELIIRAGSLLFRVLLHRKKQHLCRQEDYSLIDQEFHLLMHQMLA